jgi:hypothetical protein
MKGVASLMLDGKVIEGNVIPIMPAGATYTVDVVLL